MESPASPGSRSPNNQWHEVYLGGSKRSEDAMIEAWALQIQELQHKMAAKDHSNVVRRGFQAKQHLGVENAQFVVVDELAPEFHVGPFTPGSRYPAKVRLSSGSGRVQSDHKRDLRGLAARLDIGAETPVDLLATSGAVSFARDPQQFMDFARAATGSRLTAIPSLIRAVGIGETIRMLRTVLDDTGHAVQSLATEQFWSRGAFRFGDLAMRFTFVPVTAAAGDIDANDSDYLRSEIIGRLLTEPVSWDFRAQFFVDATRTPIEDGSVPWAAEYVTLARLTIPSQNLAHDAHADVEGRVDNMEYNPWTTIDEMRPLGSINRARRRIYEASQEARKRS